MGLFDTMLQNMERMEFFQLLFPFLLAFAIMYGALQTVFKEKLGGSRVQALIAIIIAFFVMLFSSYNTWFVDSLTSMSGIWLSVATLIIFVVVLLELAGVSVRDMVSGEKGWLKWIIVLILIYVVLAAFFGFGVSIPGLGLPYWMTGTDFWTLIFFIFLLGVIFWWVGHGDKKAEAPPAGGPQK